MLSWRTVARVLLGIFVIKHALGHSVLPFRGAIEYPPSTMSAMVMLNVYLVALSPRLPQVSLRAAFSYCCGLR